MKKLLAAFAASLVMVSASAQTVPAPAIAAKSWLLLDATSGQVIASQEQNMRIEPASLTKVMTAYVAFAAIRDKRISLDQMVNVSERAWKVDASSSKMFIDPRVPVSINDLLHGLMIQSGNDAAVAIAEAVAGDEATFVTLMNREAQRMGLKSTRFANPHGLPDANNYSTAADLAQLAAHVIRDFPDLYKIDSIKQFTYNKITQQNRNRLLWLDPTVDGGKTGHTKSAGYCLVTSANRPLPDVPGASRRLLSVIVGTKSDQIRTQESLKVLNYGYQFFDTLRLYDAQQVLQTPDVYKGQAKNVKIGVMDAKWITVPKGMGGHLKPVLERKDPLIAPIAQGQPLGTVKVMDGATVVQEFPVVALEAVPEAGFIGRTIDSIKLWFKKK